MKIQHVATEFVNQTWPLVEAHLQSALGYQTDYTLDQVKVYVATGQWMLIVAVDEDGVQGATVINFFNRPSDRVAFVVAMGGKLISSKETFAQFKQLLNNFGATYLEGAAREAIARLWTRYGLEEKYRIVGVKIC
jgi:hypothetical protein